MRALGNEVRRADPGILGVHPYLYGWLGAAAIRLPLLGPAVRRAHVKSFQRWLAELTRLYGTDAQLSVVGHSFGTYLIGHAMTEDTGEPRAFFDRVILMGSILSSRDTWEERDGHYHHVLNLFSREDEVVRFSTFGQSGWCGFRRPRGSVYQLPMPGYEHTTYLRPGVAWSHTAEFLSNRHA